MNYYPETDSHIKDEVKVVLDLSNYATKKELECATGVDTSGLAAKNILLIVLNAKNSQVKNKIPVVGNLVKKTDYNTEILEIEGKYITNFDFNKFTKEILDVRIKQKELVDKSYISNLVKIFDLKYKTCNISNKNRTKSRTR